MPFAKRFPNNPLSSLTRSVLSRTTPPTPFFTRSCMKRRENPRIESAFDSFFLNSFSKNEKPPKISLPKLSPCERQDLFLLYASIVARAGFPPLRKRTFFRAVSLFNAYLPPSSHSLRLKNAVWISAVTPKANLLFERAVRRSLAVCQEFAFAVKKNTPLSYEVFGKNYLTDVLIPRE